MPTKPFPESHANAPPPAKVHIALAGTPLEAILDEFRGELTRVGIRRLRPHFYLADEWGVPWETISIAIPFYLASPELTRIHAERAGHVEGAGRPEILRYLRHEMGHVVNYAYLLYDREDWVKTFGTITQPYEEEYRPEPFSRRFVRHLPGWYAQKHPDEDWAETFAVWMTPGRDWRADYADWPEAMAKLRYCDRLMAALNDRDPPVTTVETEEAADEWELSLDEFYGALPAVPSEIPPGLDGALRTIFEDYGSEEGSPGVPRHRASALIRRLEHDLLAHVYRWTGHFPERTRPLLRHLAARADELNQVYPEGQELAATVALTTLVTALAMNHVHRGSYAPRD
jgi:hypothetical protein